ncbi:MAG: guanylate kinase [Novosphingobium sp.]|nr:guanylate kinase [Novosphingobium sp.]
MANSESLHRRGLMFVLSSPSGAGKTTISRMLLNAEDNLHMSVSVTTRPMRPGEIDGKDYIFARQPEFDRMVAEEAFLEWAEVFGNCYGTPKAEIEAGLRNGKDYLFDIDWQGAQQLHQRAGTDVVKVFLLPPSLAELENRLHSRGTDSDEVIRGRMDRARAEISHYGEYDYVVINDDMQTCFANVRSILAAERLKRERRTGLGEFVRELMR